MPRRCRDSRAEPMIYVLKSVDPADLRVRVRALLRKAEADRAIPDVESRFRQARLLVIDDSPTFLGHVVRKELETEHYYVETADSPDEGLRRLEAATFDCVLVDYEMPVLDGGRSAGAFATRMPKPSPKIYLGAPS